MAGEFSFDIVSRVEMQEVKNAVQQAQREIAQRFDFKGSKSEIELDDRDNTLTILSDDEFKLRSVIDILVSRLAKRGVPFQALDFGRTESAAGGTVRQCVKVKQGIPEDKAKEITNLIRGSKFKVKSQILGDHIRVSGKSKDELQAVIAMIKQHDFGLPLQFTNYR